MSHAEAPITDDSRLPTDASGVGGETEVATPTSASTQQQLQQHRAALGIFPEVTGVLQKRVLDLVTRSAEYQFLKVGSNMTTAAIERGEADFVVLAADTTPLEIVMHLPLLCEAHGIPYCFVSSRVALGRAARQ